MAASASRLTEVCFNPPIYIEIAAPVPEGRKDTYSYTEIIRLTDDMRLDGWDERAIVMLRSLQNKYYNAMPSNWGIVVDLKRTMVYRDVFYPLKVKWFDGSTSEHWPEDLFMVHRAISRLEVDELINKQEL